jgi:hypothetical protein
MEVMGVRDLLALMALTEEEQEEGSVMGIVAAKEAIPPPGTSEGLNILLSVQSMSLFALERMLPLFPPNIL